MRFAGPRPQGRDPTQPMVGIAALADVNLTDGGSERGRYQDAAGDAAGDAAPLCRRMVWW